MSTRHLKLSNKISSARNGLLSHWPKKSYSPLHANITSYFQDYWLFFMTQFYVIEHSEMKLVPN